MEEKNIELLIDKISTLHQKMKELSEQYSTLARKVEEKITNIGKNLNEWRKKLDQYEKGNLKESIQEKIVHLEEMKEIVAHVEKLESKAIVPMKSPEESEKVVKKPSQKPSSDYNPPSPAKVSKGNLGGQAAPNKTEDKLEQKNLPQKEKKLSTDKLGVTRGFDYLWEKEPTEKQKTAKTKEAKTTKRKILLVDDDPEIVRITKFCLDKNDFLVVVARDGVEAIARAIEEKPDLIILDLTMPHLGGYETLKRLQNISSTKRTPILIHSAKLLDESTKEMLKLEPNVLEFMHKPSPMEDFLKKITQLLNTETRK